jgi:hypothetical protein
MKPIVTHVSRVFAVLAMVGLAGGLTGCTKPASDATNDTPLPAMEHEEREREVERIQQELEQGGGTSPAELQRHIEGRPEEFRRDFYALLWRIGTASASPQQRTGVVEFLLRRTPAETPLLRGQLLKWLQDFRKQDFNDEAAEVLTGLPWAEGYLPEVIRLFGVAEVQEAIPRLREQVANEPLLEPPPPGFHEEQTWAAMLALSRLGDDQSLNAVIRRVRQERDIIVRATILFADLGYTRQPAAFDVLKEYLNSDARMPRIKDNVPGELEAARAAAEFARHIRGFPIQETDFSEAEVMEARAWVNSQTAWEFN